MPNAKLTPVSKRISLAPLDVEDVLAALLRVPAPPKTKKPAKKARRPSGGQKKQRRRKTAG